MRRLKISYKKLTERIRPGRSREKWTDIFPRYLTFISHMRPILRETRRIIINLDPDLLLDPDLEILDNIRQEEENRNIRKVYKINGIVKENQGRRSRRIYQQHFILGNNDNLNYFFQQSKGKDRF